MSVWWCIYDEFCCWGYIGRQASEGRFAFGLWWLHIGSVVLGIWFHLVSLIREGTYTDGRTCLGICMVGEEDIYVNNRDL